MTTIAFTVAICTLIICITVYNVNQLEQEVELARLQFYHRERMTELGANDQVIDLYEVAQDLADDPEMYVDEVDGEEDEVDEDEDGPDLGEGDDYKK
jgi:hypothetical protein